MTAAVCLVFFGALALHAQPAFDVVSVKANRSTTGGASFEITPGSLSVHNMILGMIIMRAYGIDEPQFVPPVPPLLLEKFDIDGKTGRPVSREQLLAMLRTVLTDRFHLKLRRDQKEMSAYALTVAKGGPKLRPHEGEPVTPCRTSRGTEGQLIYKNCPMSVFVGFRPVAEVSGLAAWVDPHFVSDETGLTGNYDFELLFSHDFPANPREGNPARTMNPGAPSIFTALEKQLGLKLESRKLPVDFYTVEHVERPAEN